MEPDFGPFPDRDSALNWLEERGSCSKDSFVVKAFTPEDVARRVQVQRINEIPGLVLDPKAVEARKALREKERNQQLALEEKARLKERMKQIAQD